MRRALFGTYCLAALGCASPATQPGGSASQSPGLSVEPVLVASVSSSAAAAPSAPLPILQRGVALIDVGAANICVLTSQGEVQCLGEWPLQFETSTSTGGRNQYIRSMLEVKGARGARSLAVDNSRGCAVMGDGTVRCWGNTFATQNGWSGANEGELTAEVAPGIAGARSVALNWRENCAALTDGSVMCWGPRMNVRSRRSGPPDPPRKLALRDVTHIAGARLHFCALVKDGSVYCWGDNRGGQLADKPSPIDDERTFPVPGLKDAVAITSGPNHNCALSKTSRVLCWGDNGNGQLGDGTTEARRTPTEVQGLGPAIAVAAADGSDMTCAITKDGATMCWGANSNCDVGDANSPSCAKRVMSSTFGQSEAVHCTAPQRIELPIRPVGVTVGTSTACAWDAEGRVACWGRSLTGGTTSCKGLPL